MKDRKGGESMTTTIIETKRDRFVRLAEKRMQRALGSIRVIRNLANTANYEYSQEDVDAIIAGLRKAVDDLEAVFASKTRRSQAFSLSK